MNFSKLQIPAGSKLYRIYHFNYMHKGIHYNIEINEFNDGHFAGYAEHSTDKNFSIESVSGKSAEECLQALINRIHDRS